MYPQFQLMKTLQDERLRAAARGHLAAEVRRARTVGPDHAAATRARATARGAATMPRKQRAIIGFGVAVYCHVLWAMRQLKKSSRGSMPEKGGERSPKSALTRTGSGKT